MIIDTSFISQACENALARHISYRLALPGLHLPRGDAMDAARIVMRTWPRERMLHFLRASKEPNQFRSHRFWAHELNVRPDAVERWSQQLRDVELVAADANGAVIGVRLFRSGVEHLSRNNSKEYGPGGCAINLGRDARTTLDAAESVATSTERQVETNVDNYLGALAVRQGADLPAATASTSDRVSRAASAIRGVRGEQLSLVRTGTA